jgi:hypothetical protein
MDSQYTSLARSYHDNYVQYKVTGNTKYKTGFEAAKQGLDTLVGQLQDQVSTQNKKMEEFYKSGVESKLIDLEQENRKLQRGILSEKDQIKAAEMRSAGAAISPNAISTWQYITLGVVGASVLVLSFL